MTKFVGLRSETHFYLAHDDGRDKKAKRKTNFAIKRRLKFEDCEKCL